MNWRKEFCLTDEIAYLNHAAMGPWPLRTQRAVAAFAKDNLLFGATHYAQWLRTERRLREHMSRMINCPAIEDIALLKNTSEALSVIAYGLPWQAGDKVVISNQEFPSNRIVWESLRRQGVEVVVADLNGPATPEQALIEAIDARTRIVSVSSVQYATGLKIDCARIGAVCRAQGVLFCVDAIQSIGAQRFDALAMNADFVVADGHKWMLGPEGVALFYSRPQARDQLRLQQYGWHMVEQRGNYEIQDWQPLDNAQRFECGSPNMLGIHALEASLSLLLEIGMDEVERLLEANMEYLVQQLLELEHIRILSPATPERRAGILTIQHRRRNTTELYPILMAAGVICAQRGGGIRFSPHFYTPLERIDRAIAVLQQG